MKVFVLLLLCYFSFSFNFDLVRKQIQPHQLIKSYSELVSQVYTGNHVKAIADFRLCTINGTKGPEAFGMITVEAAEWFGKGIVGPTEQILFSEAKLIHHRGYGRIYNYGRFRVEENNQVTIGIEYWDAVTMRILYTAQYICRIFDGTNKEGAIFYSK